MSSFVFEASGKAKLPTAEEFVKLDQESNIIVLSRGTRDDGRPFYAYIAIIPSKYAEFIRLTEERTPLIPEEYGEVLFYESLQDPSEPVVQYMRAAYDFDETFQQRLIAEFKKEQKVFVGKKEEKRIQDIVAMMKKQPIGNA